MKKWLLSFITVSLPLLMMAQCPVPTFSITPIGLTHFNITSPSTPGALINWGPPTFNSGTAMGPGSGGVFTVIDSNLIAQFHLASCAYGQVRVAKICGPGDTSLFTPYTLLPLPRHTYQMQPFGPIIEISNTAGTGPYAIPECYVPQHDTLTNGSIQHWQYGNMGPSGLPPVLNRPFMVDNDSALFINGLTQTGAITLETPQFFFGYNFYFDAEARFSIYNDQAPGQTPPTILIEAIQPVASVVDTILILDTITSAWLDITYSFANNGFFSGNSIYLRVTTDYGNVTSPSTSTVWLTPFRVGDSNTFTCNNLISMLEHYRDSITSAQLILSQSNGIHPFSPPSDLVIEYGPVGFTPKAGNGTVLTYPFPAVPANQSAVIDTFRLPNLLPNMAYEVYLYDTCTQIAAGNLQGPFLISGTPEIVLKGKVVLDETHSCSPQSSGVAFQQLLLLPDSIYTVTNQNGIYEFLPNTSGPWQVELLPDNRTGGFIRSSCSPNPTVSVPLVANTNLYTNINFFLDNPVPELLVHQVLMNILVYNQGFSHTLNMHFTNFTNNPITDLNFSLTTDSVEFIMATDPFITFMTNDTIHFNFTNISIPVGGSFLVQHAVKANVHNTTVGQFLPTTVTIHQPTGLTTTEYTDSFEVVAAYDPNDKMVTPGGEIFEFADELEYRIRFQNTGNFFATNVVVTDTLPAELDLEGLRVQSASHNFRLERQGNVAHFIFDNIFLPDSASDPDGSIGYFIFKAPLLTPMALGDSISNRAYIYFDFQAPIITNDAWVKVVPNTISTSNRLMENQLQLYPNPNTGTFQVAVDIGNINLRKLQLVNSLGQVVWSAIPTPGEHQKTIDIRAQAKGVYLMQVYTDKGMISRRVVVH